MGSEGGVLALLSLVHPQCFLVLGVQASPRSISVSSNTSQYSPNTRSQRSQSLWLCSFFSSLSSLFFFFLSYVLIAGIWSRLLLYRSLSAPNKVLR